MSIVFTHDGLKYSGQNVLALGGAPSLARFSIYFYSNDVTPGIDTAKATYEVANPLLIFSIDVANSDAVETLLADRVRYTWPTNELTVEGELTIYGYFVVCEDDDSFAYFAERFEDGPFEWGPSGGVFVFTPRLECMSI